MKLVGILESVHLTALLLTGLTPVLVFLASLVGHPLMTFESSIILMLMAFTGEIFLWLIAIDVSNIVRSLEKKVVLSTSNRG